MQPVPLLQDLMEDLRVGIRSLMRVPMLTLTIIVTVGIGIGATAAIFSAINAAMLRPLPYAEPDRLVRIYTDTPPFKFRFSAVDYLHSRNSRRDSNTRRRIRIGPSASATATLPSCCAPASCPGVSFRCWA